MHVCWKTMFVKAFRVYAICDILRNVYLSSEDSVGAVVDTGKHPPQAMLEGRQQQNKTVVVPGVQQQ